MSDTPKTAVELILDDSKLWAKELLDGFGEPDAVIITFAWKIAKNDFPVGLMVTREGTASIELALECVQQLSKHEDGLMKAVIGKLSQVGEAIKHESSTSGANKPSG